MTKHWLEGITFFNQQDLEDIDKMYDIDHPTPKKEGDMERVTTQLK